ncbi:hypothetical protein BpHYR1_026652 [Brachionus plicatilis]|uniref:Uncharacterized protein n=1 Tax=Brachionus plicatilis TaxID=10195 RepID=A0A3M7RN63_BRAPC|nr:hypothetical protein BpHYR1_026652 [Brachionus plicatilis]
MSGNRLAETLNYNDCLAILSSRLDYPSEPILAAASAILMEQNFPFILNTLIIMTKSNLISTGGKGEIIAKLILQRAIGKAFLSSGTSQSSIKYINSVKVESSMKYLSIVNSLKRYAAILCIRNQMVFDLIIPVSINENDFQSISAIMIQVKLNENPPLIDFASACLPSNVNS